MAKMNFKGLSLDELISAREEIDQLLAARVASERRELEAKLARLSKYGEPVRGRNGAKGYKVEPKYRNPADPTQTWAGRGMQPKWVAAALRSGSSLEDLMVNRS